MNHAMTRIFKQTGLVLKMKKMTTHIVLVVVTAVETVDEETTMMIQMMIHTVVETGVNSIAMVIVDTVGVIDQIMTATAVGIATAMKVVFKFYHIYHLSLVFIINYLSKISHW